MSKQATIVALVAAIVIGALIVFSKRQPSALNSGQPQNPLAQILPGIYGPQANYIKPMGPNTPVNTSGSAPYRPFASTGSPPGPTVAAASLAFVQGLLSGFKSVFQGNSSEAGTVASYPGGPSQQPLDLLAPSVAGGIGGTLAPPYQLIPLPAIPPSISNPNAFGTPIPPPPDISLPAPTSVQTLDLTQLSPGIYGPSPIVTPAVDFSTITGNIGPQSSGYVPVDTGSLPVDYASPSYVYDGGEPVLV